MAKELYVTTQANLAQAHLKLARYDQAIQCCSLALAVDPGHVKSLFRRASARLLDPSANDDVTAIETDLNRVVELAPEEKGAVEQKRAELAELRRRHDARQKALFSRMMGGGA